MAVNLLPQTPPQNHGDTRAAAKPDDAANADAPTFSDTLVAAATALAPKTPLKAPILADAAQEVADAKAPRTTADDDLATLLLPATAMVAIDAAPGARAVLPAMPASVRTATATATDKHEQMCAAYPNVLVAASLDLLTPHLADSTPRAASVAITPSSPAPVAAVRLDAKSAQSSVREPVALQAAAAEKVDAPTRSGSADVAAQFAANLLQATHDDKSPRTSDAAPSIITTDARALNAAPTPPVVQVTIATPAFTPAWRDEVTQQLTQFVMMRQDRAEIRLHPADLGPISVRIQMDGDQANLLIQAPQAATRDGLELALPQLRDSLAQQGITLGQANVRDERQPQPEARDGTLPYANSTSVIASTVPSEAPVRVRLGLVDLFA